MEQLIPIKPIVIGNENIAVNARDLHEFLEVGKDFSTWIKDRIDKYELIERVDYICSPNLGSKTGRGGHNRIEYVITLDCAKELAMVENNERGRQARKYFIEVEKQFMANYIPIEKITKADLARMILESEAEKAEIQKKLDASNTLVRTMKPKVDVFEQLILAKEVVDIGQASKLLGGIGRNRLFKRLRDSGVFFQTRNEPKQQFIEAGYFKVKEIPIQTNTETIIKLKVYVTQKGLAWLHHRLNIPQQRIFTIN